MKFSPALFTILRKFSTLLTDGKPALSNRFRFVCSSPEARNTFVFAITGSSVVKATTNARFVLCKIAVIPGAGSTANNRLQQLLPP